MAFFCSISYRTVGRSENGGLEIVLLVSAREKKKKIFLIFYLKKRYIWVYPSEVLFVSVYSVNTVCLFFAQKDDS